MTLPSRIWLAILVLGLISAPAFAQRITFDPRISLWARYYDDADFIGARREGDRSYRLRLDLPLTRSTKRSQLIFSYSPYFERFSTVDEFDHTGHVGQLRFESRPKPEALLGLRAGYSRIQDQGDPSAEDDADLFLTRRFIRERSAAEVTWSDLIRKRWRWGFGLEAKSWDFEELDAGRGGAGAADLENRSGLSGSLDFARVLSERTAIGVRYERRRFDLERTGVESADLVSATLERSVGERLDMRLQLGVARVTRLDPDRGTDVSRTRGQGRFSLNRTLRRLVVEVTASYEPSAGGAFSRTSTNSRAAISVSDASRNRWGWRIGARYGRREPNSVEQGTVETQAAGGSVRFDLGRRVSMALELGYVEQTSRIRELDGDAIIAGLGLSWHPLRGTRWADQARD